VVWFLWLFRKQIISSRAVNQELLSRELHIAGVVLSCGPKSEEAWAYRYFSSKTLLFLEPYRFIESLNHYFLLFLKQLGGSLAKYAEVSESECILKIPFTVIL
jgi:hypothetical protein